MARHPKQCVFCGTPGVTKEHVWGKWLKPYIPRTMINYRKFHVSQDGQIPDVKEELRAGDPRSLSVKCVCRTCNGGWMGDLQEAAKPVMIPLAMGNAAI